MGMDIYGKSGNYFRASVWSWRPIHALCDDLNAKHGLGLDLSHWGYNDGAGLRSAKQCEVLALALENEITRKDAPAEYELASDCRVDRQGCFVDNWGQKTTETRSAYHTDRAHIAEFIKFLRDCGGSFEIN